MHVALFGPALPRANPEAEGLHPSFVITAIPIAAIGLFAKSIVSLVWISIFVTMVVAVTVSWSWLRRRGLARAPEWVDRAIATQTDQRFRLRLAAGNRDAFALRTLSDDPFEPRLFNLWFALPRRRLLAGLVLVFFVTSWNACITMTIVSSPGIKSPPALQVLLPLVTIAAVGTLFAFPTYFRIVPGRLDVMQYFALSRSKPSISKFDLRSSRVLVDLNRDVILIEPSDGPVRILRVGSVVDRIGLARAIFEAARSTHPAPPLPDDALLG